jgi:GTPase
VITVAAGDAEHCPLPPAAGEAESRLAGLRLVHVHLKEGGLSRADLTSLFLNRLDLMVAVDVRAGSHGAPELGLVHVATVAPPTSDEEDWLIDAPTDFAALEREDVLERVAALEEELARAYRARDVRRGSEERAVLVGLDTGEGPLEAQSRLDELVELLRSAGGVVAFEVLQARSAPDARTLVGRGKLEEVVSAAYHENADLLVFDRELTPAQAREIEKATKLKVLDRTQVILDIFAQNARGREAQVQVELAQLQYQLPRLAGRGAAMSRLGGGIGTRGPGETKLEVDRRRIRERWPRSSATSTPSAVGAARAARGARTGRRRSWRWSATPTPASRRCSTPWRSRACWPRTRSSPRCDRRRARAGCRSAASGARPCCSPTPSASSATCPASS